MLVSLPAAPHAVRAVARLGLAGALGVVAATACAQRGPGPTRDAGGARRAAAPAAPARLASAPDQFVAVAGVRLRYREIGRGEPVVLLHGFAATLGDWGAAAGGLSDSLAAGYRVIVLDQRGHGRSSKLTDPARFGREMGADVVRLLDHLRVQRAHLVGHSMGGVVAAYVAARHPDRVATASLVAPPFYADSATAARVMAPVVAGLEQGGGFRAFFRQFAPGMPDSLAGAISAQMVAENDLGSLVAVMRAFGGFQVGRTGAASARVPALVAVGTDDVLVTNARDLATWWPQARLLEIAGAGHVDVLARPELLAAVRAQLGVRTAGRSPSGRAAGFAHTPWKLYGNPFRHGNGVPAPQTPPSG